MGTALILLGAFANGSFGLLLKYSRGWKWEHIWLVFSFVGMLVIPWGVGLVTVKALPTVLSSANSRDVAFVFIFGMGWGLGAVLYGRALEMVGLALSYAIVMGLTAAIGSLTPLVLLHPEEIFTLRGKVIIAAVLLIVAAVVHSAWAGQLRENAIAKSSAGVAPLGGRKNFSVGLLVAFASGILSPMLNMSFAYGAPLAKLAAERGTNPLFANNIIWTIALSAGFLVNAFYCAYLITRRHSWHMLKVQTFHYILAILMAVLWSAGYLLYGIGGSQLGDLSAVVGWPLMSSMTIISANFWGMVSGEWANAGRKAISIMTVSVVMLCLGMIIIGYAETIR